jgi:hypothetical protein
MTDGDNRFATPLPDRVTVGIVLERRDSAHPWQDHVWSAQAVMPGGGPAGGWRVLDMGPGWTRYYAGCLDLQLFPRETESYRQNLSCDPPSLYVVLRPGESKGESAGEGEEEGGHEVEPFLITACPFEAQDYMDSGEETVENVPMPAEMAAWVQAFVERHHVDEPFIKRKQKPKQCGVTTEPFARKPMETCGDR